MRELLEETNQRRVVALHGEETRRWVLNYSDQEFADLSYGEQCSILQKLKKKKKKERVEMLHAGVVGSAV